MINERGQSVIFNGKNCMTTALRSKPETKEENLLVSRQIWTFRYHKPVLAVTIFIHDLLLSCLFHSMFLLYALHFSFCFPFIFHVAVRDGCPRWTWVCWRALPVKKEFFLFTTATSPSSSSLFNIQGNLPYFIKHIEKTVNVNWH